MRVCRLYVFKITDVLWSTTPLLHHFFISASNEQSTVLARVFCSCRESQIHRSLLRSIWLFGVSTQPPTASANLSTSSLTSCLPEIWLYTSIVTSLWACPIRYCSALMFMPCLAMFVQAVCRKLWAEILGRSSALRCSYFNSNDSILAISLLPTQKVLLLHTINFQRQTEFFHSTTEINYSDFSVCTLLNTITLLQNMPYTI